MCPGNYFFRSHKQEELYNVMYFMPSHCHLEAWWSHGWCARLWIEQSRFKPWQGTLYFALCSWARHFILTVPLSTQVYTCTVNGYWQT